MVQNSNPILPVSSYAGVPQWAEHLSHSWGPQSREDAGKWKALSSGGGPALYRHKAGKRSPRRDPYARALKILTLCGPGRGLSEK